MKIDNTEQLTMQQSQMNLIQVQAEYFENKLKRAPKRPHESENMDPQPIVSDAINALINRNFIILEQKIS